MLFNEHLYTIVTSSQDELKADFQIRLNASHAIFSAHFPGEPILPGACIVQVVAELVTLWKSPKEETLPIVKMSNLKFLTIISPDEVLDLHVTLETKSQENGQLRVAASVFDTEKEYSKMTLTFAYGE